ncbi:hypothetical protein CC2G_008033 [Coprinopsis cinerea AmutBmut pab1-1]|nr:hypothetical protein CC2G_008033 [Coprinopsis cinerea AmutBmut pab1-1]
MGENERGGKFSAITSIRSHQLKGVSPLALTQRSREKTMAHHHQNEQVVKTNKWGATVVSEFLVYGPWVKMMHFLRSQVSCRHPVHQDRSPTYPYRKISRASLLTSWTR